MRSTATLRPKALNFQETSSKLLQSVSKLLHRDGGLRPRDYQFMFQDVYALCTAYPQPFVKDLYALMKTFFTDHVAALRQSIEDHQADMLIAYKESFDVYYHGTRYIDNAFSYLNKELDNLSQTSNAKFGLFNEDETYVNMAALGLRIWREALFQPLQDRIIRTTLKEFERDRMGEACNMGVVAKVLNSLVKMCSYEKQSLELYTRVFQTPFLEATATFYQRETAECLSHADSSTYLRKALTRLEEEALRARKFLHPVSLEQLRDCCVKVMVESKRVTLESEATGFIERMQVDDLQRLYSLLSRIKDGFSVVLTVLERHILDDGMKKLAVLQRETTLTPGHYVDMVTALHKQYSALLTTAFSNDPAFQAAMDKAFRVIVNQRLPGSAQVPELLAKYCDGILRKSSKGGLEFELDDRLGEVVVIFQYIDDKDVFQKFYAKSLAKRLIHATSVSDDAEAGMINRLKQLCGFEYTSKLQKMFTDMTLSDELNVKFMESIEAVGMGIGFRILVLQSGAWPLGQSAVSNFHIPQALQGSIHAFEGFYEKCHSGRKLNWMHHLGMADVKANFGAKNFEFAVTTYQMAVLLIFNDEGTSTVQHIRDSTSLSEKELERTLRSLLSCKLLITADNAGSGPLSADMSVSVNLEYSNKKKKVKISAAIQRETPQESQSTRSAVEDDRKLFLQAAIVRVMKTRKQLTYQLLINEVVEQSKGRFSPSIPQIKKCIDELIDKQYVERSDQEKSVLNYIA